MNSQRLFTGLSLLSISLAAHGSLFFCLNRAASHYQVQIAEEQKNILKEKGGRLEFQYIEAPPKIAARKPLRTKKISNRDALNQDILKDKSKAAVLPHATSQGYSDQLAQLQGKPSQMLSPRVEPSKTREKESETRHSERAPVSKESHNVILTEAINLKSQNENSRHQAPRDDKSSKSQVDVKKNDLNRPKVNPKPQIRGAGGADKITTQEMGKIKSPGAMLFGQTSFEATGSGMGQYMKRLKEKIWLSWFPYLAYQYPQDFRGADVVVSFTLDSKGDVKIVKVVDSMGSPLFASYCIQAIQKASGFGTLPKEILELIGKDELEIKFGFHYR